MISPRLSPRPDASTQAGNLADDPLILGNCRFQSRLIVGTGKYSSFEIMQRALLESGAEMVTVAVRRVDFSGDPSKNLLNFIDRKRYTILPNTAGCYDAG